MKLFITQDHPMSILELSMIALGHLALGIIIALAFIGG